jgi:L-alanine-DL-glutamate epimerase-like enolase superfamily enzyme
MNNTLKITSVELYKADIPFHEPFKIAIMEIPCAQSVFVKLITNKGIYGMGEANPYWAITGETQATCLAAANDLAKIVLGKNPLDIETLCNAMNMYLRFNSTIRSAFDMALYDIAGKFAGMPLYSLLGGSKRIFWTDNTIGLRDPEYVAKKAIEYKQMGFRAIKVKLGTTKELDTARIKSLRNAIGDELPIRVDANQGWDFYTAINTLKALEQFGIEYCEQPIAHWDYDNLKRVRQSTSIPIMADESLFDHHDAFKLASNRCCDYFNIKLAKSGGILNALKINSIAEGAGIKCMMGGMTETRLGLSAAAHVTSARPNIQFADLDGHLFMKEDPIIGGAQYEIGTITITDTPGHGADVDPAFLKSCEKIIIK